MKFFSVYDVALVPVCFLFLLLILRSRANRYTDKVIRSVYYKGFYFKMICVLLFTLITEFYFGGGDTNLYYQGVKDLRSAISDDANLLSWVLKSSTLEESNPLSPYFLYDNYAYDFTYNYMKSSGNFFMPKLALAPSFLFFNNYLCISMCFAFFALGGALRLFKLFYHYYPKASRELTIAIVLLPSVGFWSAGLLKDTICFGALGFSFYALFNIFIRKAKFWPSLIWLIVCSYLLFSIKTYIFLVLVLAVVVWMFAETNQLVRDISLRRGFAFITFTVGIVIAFFLVRYFTSQETMRQYQFENIASSAEFQRSNYAVLESQTQGSQGSYFQINNSNPFLLVANSIVVTFFRPFIWEVKSAAAILSAVEAIIFLLLTANLFARKGLRKPFQAILADPRMLMCLVFALVFAIGVGASTANFGALSRYKIPCLPFYLAMICLTYRKLGLNYPRWFNKILNTVKF